MIRLQRTLTTLLLLAALMALSGCAFSPTQPETRSIAVAAERDQALRAGLEMLVERGFVIRHADADLGRVDAILASRPAYEVRYDVEAENGSTRIALSGRRGGQPLAPITLDPLLNDVSARLGLAP
ncbi:hypothetical protein [Halomonas sp. WWR20]